MIQIQFAKKGSSSSGKNAFFIAENAEGSGTMTCYELFDGVQLAVLHLETQSFTEKRTKQDALEINFCANVRFESRFSERDCVMLTPGDMAVSSFDGIHGVESESIFPLGRYDGLCIMVNCGAAHQWMQKHAPGFATEFVALQDRLLAGRWYVAGSAGPRCEHVFREIYENAAYFDLKYLRLKVLELFMLLARIPCAPALRGYCSSRQMEIIRHLRDHLLSEGYAALPRLAEEHGMSVSHLQRLFRKVYGVPIYHYIQEYRLEQAAVELTGSLRKITEIALDAGYSSVSKFSACFKKRYGTTPSEYRREAHSMRKSEQSNENGIAPPQAMQYTLS